MLFAGTKNGHVNSEYYVSSFTLVNKNKSDDLNFIAKKIKCCLYLMRTKKRATQAMPQYNCMILKLLYTGKYSCSLYITLFLCHPVDDNTARNTKLKGNFLT